MTLTQKRLKPSTPKLVLLKFLVIHSPIEIINWSPNSLNQIQAFIFLVKIRNCMELNWSNLEKQ